MKKKPPDQFRQDIHTAIDFMAADERIKKEHIRRVLEALKKFPKDQWQDIIEKVLKDLT